MLERRKFIQGLAAATSLLHLAGNALNQFNSWQPQAELPADPVNSLEEEIGMGTRIKVIGVGLSGWDIVGHMIECGVRGAEFISAGAHAMYLRPSAAHHVLLRSSSSAVSRPTNARYLAEESIDAIRAAIDGSHMLLVTADMGDPVGHAMDCSAAPVIARVAREIGILTVGLVTMPFAVMGGFPMRRAIIGLAELEANVDSLILVVNDNLLEVTDGDLTVSAAHLRYENVLKHVVSDLAGMINLPQFMGVDYEDVRTILGRSGRAMMGSATVGGPDRARRAAEQAVASPMFEGVDLSGAEGVLVLVAASRGTLKLVESKLAMNTVRAHASADAHVIYGMTDDDSLDDQIRVTIIATGWHRTALPSYLTLGARALMKSEARSTVRFEALTANENDIADHELPNFFGHRARTSDGSKLEIGEPSAPFVRRLQK